MGGRGEKSRTAAGLLRVFTVFAKKVSERQIIVKVFLVPRICSFFFFY